MASPPPTLFYSVHCANGRTYAVEGFGEAPRGYPASPKSPFPARLGGFAAQTGRKIEILEGLQPSKPPA